MRRDTSNTSASGYSPDKGGTEVNERVKSLEEHHDDFVVDPYKPFDNLPDERSTILTVRAVFVGGSRAVTIPWHAVGRSFPQNRDLVLVRSDREGGKG